MDSASGLRLRPSSTAGDTDDAFDSLSPSMSFSSTIGDDGSSVYSFESTCRPQPSLEIEEIPDPTWCWSPTPQSSPSPISATVQPQRQKSSSRRHSFGFGFIRRHQLPTSAVIGSGKQSSKGNGNKGAHGRIGRTIAALNLRAFTLSEIKKATQNFTSCVGRGGFGTVYMGWVDEKTLNPTNSRGGMAVTIKRFADMDEMQFEIDLFGQLSHPNLVKILGYCKEKELLCLVYEYMSNGNLDRHLFERETTNLLLSWDFRLKTAISVARCITFLHTLDTPIIYGDVKSSNVFLDSNYDIKLASCDISKLGAIGNDSHVSTLVAGTYGYIDPTYMQTGHLFVKSDVYSFGVVLLEMLSGLRAIDMTRSEEQKQLVAWLEPYLPVQKNLGYFMDPRLEGQYPLEAAYQTAQLVLKCLLLDPTMRPSMKEVLEILEEIEALKD